MRKRHPAAEVFAAFLVLGLTSFGGPVAHLGYFREAFVVRRRWMGEDDYADLVALCQFLPGPASSQVGMGIGLQRAGWPGLLAAWTAFTLPSAVLLVAFASGSNVFRVDPDAGWLRGLQAAAVAVVAHAVLGMARTLATGWRRATLAVLAFAIALMLTNALGQVLGLVVAAGLGLLWLRVPVPTGRGGLGVPVRPRVAAALLAVFVVLLVALPVAAAVTGSSVLGLMAGFYRAGSLVFGGGHVVLPLLEAETVARGLVDPSVFLAGYGAAQAVPGPLFTIAAYLGAVNQGSPTGVLGGAVALLAIFLPSALLVGAALPFWARLRASPRIRRALAGAGAGVVGLLAAAFVDPVLSHGVTSLGTGVVAVLGFAALMTQRVPAWAVVLGAAALGALSR